MNILLVKTIISIPLLVLVSCAVVPETAGTKPHSIAHIKNGVIATAGNQVVTGNLHVLTLNMAHGRKEAVNQLLLSEQEIRNNLIDIAALLNKVGADIVALQEADGPSRWSGDFDHVELLAQLANYPWYARASHAKSSWFDYGTAILSKVDLGEVVVHSFSPSPPTLSKGFVMGKIEWLPDAEIVTPIRIDVISVHLDFSRAEVRQKQIDEMIEVLADSQNPVIILGDFNNDWFSDVSVIHEITRRCRVHAYRPAAEDLGTYRKNGRRLDWVLISEDLGFKNYVVVPDVISDHYAVLAEVFLKNVKAVKQGAAVNGLNCEKNTGDR